MVYFEGVLTAAVTVITYFSFFYAFYGRKMNLMTLKVKKATVIVAMLVLEITTEVVFNSDIVRAIASLTISYVLISVLLDINIRELAGQFLVCFSIMEMGDSAVEFIIISVTDLSTNMVMLLSGVIDLIWIWIIYLVEKILRIKKGSFLLPLGIDLYFGIFLCVIAVQYSYFSTYLSATGMKAGQELVAFMHAANGVVILFGEISLIYFFNLKHIAESEKEVAVKFNAIQREHFVKLLEKEDETRQYRHDMIAQLVQLDRYLQMNEPKRALEFVDTMLNDISEISERGYNVGNDVVNTMLDFYLDQNKEHATVRGFMPQDVTVSDTDLCIITSNLLKNAIEASEQLPFEKRKIEVIVSSGKFSWGLVVTNVIAPECSDTSRKKDPRNHGFGLRHIEEAVKKYNGTFKAVKNTDTFTAEVRIPF